MSPIQSFSFRCVQTSPFSTILVLLPLLLTTGAQATEPRIGVAGTCGPAAVAEDGSWTAEGGPGCFPCSVVTEAVVQLHAGSAARPESLVGEAGKALIVIEEPGPGITRLFGVPETTGSPVAITEVGGMAFARFAARGDGWVMAVEAAKREADPQVDYSAKDWKKQQKRVERLIASRPEVAPAILLELVGPDGRLTGEKITVPDVQFPEFRRDGERLLLAARTPAERVADRQERTFEVSLSGALAVTPLETVPPRPRGDERCEVEDVQGGARVLWRNEPMTEPTVLLTSTDKEQIHQAWCGPSACVGTACVATAGGRGLAEGASVNALAIHRPPGWGDDLGNIGGALFALTALLGAHVYLDDVYDHGVQAAWPAGPTGIGLTLDNIRGLYLFIDASGALGALELGPAVRTPGSLVRGSEEGFTLYWLEHHGDDNHVTLVRGTGVCATD